MDEWVVQERDEKSDMHAEEGMQRLLNVLIRTGLHFMGSDRHTIGHLVAALLAAVASTAVATGLVATLLAAAVAA